MTKGDIILISFPFTDLIGTKLRPAVILAVTSLDVTVSFITSQVSWSEATDLFLQPNNSNGLKKPSLIRTGKIATIDKKLAKGLLGELNGVEIEELNIKLKILLQIP